MADPLTIVIYPDPRLRKHSRPVSEFTPDLAELASQMLSMMRAEAGVGLAAPQVGKDIRLFVMNATGKPEDDHVYINPELSDADGDEEAEEGCLSIPEVRARIFRAKTVRLKARDLTGKAVEQTASGFVSRIWQHEVDHLNGVLIVDRMGPSAKIVHKPKLKELEEKYKRKNPGPPKK